jgi:hypothetical protein
MKEKLEIDDELIDVCKKITNENKTNLEWQLVESDDCFQTSHYVGGWDSTEEAFCFSYYDDSDQEYWFQIDLEQVNKIQKGEKVDILLRKSD